MVSQWMLRFSLAFLTEHKHSAMSTPLVQMKTAKSNSASVTTEMSS